MLTKTIARILKRY